MNVIEELDRQAAKTIRWLMRVDPKAPIEPSRANAIVFALRFRAELFGQYQAGAVLAELQADLEAMKALVRQHLSQ